MLAFCRICGVLSVWMQNYPGDFSGSSTFALLSPFLQSLLPSGATWVAHYALELIPLLPSISAHSDPESSWALPDKDVIYSPIPASTVPKEESPGQRRPSVAPSYDSSNSQSMGAAATTLSVPLSRDGSGPPPSSLSPRPASEAGTLDTQDSGGDSQGFGTSSTASSRLRSGTNVVGLIEASNIVMEMREEDVALQITRLAWEMFGGMTVSRCFETLYLAVLTRNVPLNSLEICFATSSRLEIQQTLELRFAIPTPTS